MNLTLGYAIFARLATGEQCPYHFPEVCPDGISEGRAHVYLRPDYPKQRLAEVKAKRLTYYAARRDDSWQEWFDCLSVRSLPLTDDQHASLLAHEHTTLPECYRSLWVGGWETPEKGRAQQTFAV